MAFEIDYGKVMQTDAEIDERIKELVGDGGAGGIDVLWTNPDYLTTFAAKTVTLDKSLDGYRFVEVIAHTYTATKYLNVISSGKIPIMGDVLGTGCLLSFTSSGPYICVRNITINSDKLGIYFTACSKSATNAVSNQTDNLRNIPYMVLGYK